MHHQIIWRFAFLNSQILRTGTSVRSTVAGLCLLACTMSSAAEKAPLPPVNPDLSRVQQIYVPEEFLGTLLRGDDASALVTTKEYERLLEKARAAGGTADGKKDIPMIGAIEYQATISGQRLVVSADIRIHSFSAHSETSLPVDGWSIESARLGDQPALVARAASGSPVLRVFFPTEGAQLLKLRISAPLQSAGSDQIVGFELLGGSSGKFSMTLPAGKFLQANGKMLARPTAVDAPADLAVAVGGMKRLELTITDRQQETKTDSLTFASTAYGLRLQPGEMTWSTATALQVFGHQIDQLICHVPRTLEVTNVSADGLESWQLDDDQQTPDQTRLTLKFRTRFDGSRKIQIQGLFSPPMGHAWEVPQLKLDQVNTHTGVISLSYADQIRLQALDQIGVRTASPGAAGPVRGGQSNLGFEVWREDFSLRFLSTLKETPLQAAITNLLLVRETELQLSSTISLVKQAKSQFEVRIRLPANYQIRSVLFEGEAVDWQVLPGDAGLNEVLIPLGESISPEQSRSIQLLAVSDPENWPIQQTPVNVALPQVTLVDAGMVEMLYGICAPEILEVSPVDLTGLDPAGKADLESLNAQLQAKGEKLRLGFVAQEAAYQGQLQISRRPGAMTVESTSYFRVERETFVTRSESRFSVSGGGLRTMTVDVSEAAGDQARFQLEKANDQTPVTQLLEQVPGAVRNGFRTWTLSFDRSLQGDYKLLIDVSLPRGAATEYSPIELRFPQAISQSGYVAIEGADDEEVRIQDQGADGKPLQAVDPVDFPAAASRPDARVVAGYRYSQPGWSIKVATTQFTRGSIPPAIGHALKLTTVWNHSTTMQEMSTLTFYAVGMQNLLVTLPHESRLWSALLDGHPVELRNGSSAMSVPLSQLDPLVSHELTLLYDAPAESTDGATQLASSPPQFSVTTGTGNQQPLSILEQAWDVHYPRSMLIIGTAGPYQPTSPLHWSSWLDRVRVLWDDLDGVTFVGSSILLLLLMGIAWLMSRASSVGLRRPFQFALLLGAILFVCSLLLPRWQPHREASRRTGGHWSDSSVTEFEMAAEGVNGVPVLGLKVAPAPTSSIPSKATHSVVRPFGSTDGVFGREKQKASSMSLGLATSPGAPPAPPAAAGEAMDIEVPAAKTESLRQEFGRLSMTAAMEIPAGLRSDHFSYSGNHSSGGDMMLKLKTADREQANQFQVVIVIALAGVAWCLRRASRKVRIIWSIATIAIPISLLSLVSGWQEIATTAVLLGGLVSLGIWAFHGVATNLERIRTVAWMKTHPALTRTVVLLLVCTTGASLQADDKPAVVSVPQAPFVVVPYKSLQELDSANRVWIPPQLFQTLWKSAHPELALPPEGSIPVAIAEANYVAEVKESGPKGLVEVKARWVAVNLTNAALSVPLPIRGVGLQSVTVEGASAAVTVTADQALAVVLPRRGAHVIDAVFSISADVSETVGQFSLETLPVASGEMVFLLPNTTERLRVRVNGGSSLLRKLEVEGRPGIQAPVDQGGRLSISWQPEAQQSDSENVVRAENHLEVRFTDAGVNVVDHVSLTVKQGAIGEARFLIPEGVSIRRLDGTDVARWEIQEVENKQRELTLQFRRQVNDQTRFQMELFQPLDPLVASQSLTLGVPAAVGVTHEVGLIGIASLPALRVTTVQATGVHQIDLNLFPQEVIPRGELMLCYRYAALPLDLKFNVARKTGDVRVVADHALSTEFRKLNLASRLNFTVSDFPRRQLEIALPAGYLTHEVTCLQCTDWYVSHTDGKSHLTVELDQPRTGNIEVILEGVIPRSAAAQALTVDVPAAVADRTISTLGMWTDSSEQVSLSQAAGWRSISPEQLPVETKRLRSTLPQFAFTSTEQAAGLAFETRKIQPELQADAAILIAAGDATVDYGLTLRWTVSHSAAETFALTVPDWLGQLDFQAEGVRQIRSEPAEKGFTRWIITALEPVRDQFLMTAAATVALPTDHIIRTPELRFQLMTGPNPFVDLPAQRQFAVLVNLSSNQLSPVEAAKLEAMAADELPLTLPAALVQQAMDIVRVRPEKLPTWRLQRSERLASSRALVLSATLTTVLQPDGSWRTRAVYGVRNRGQQFLPLKIPEGAGILSVIVRDQPSRTVLTTKDSVPLQLVPLPQTSASDLSFDVVVILSGQLPHALPRATSWLSRQVSIPSPSVLSPVESAELGVSTAQTLWNVYVPEGLSVTPVKNSKITNVTWHQKAGWLEAEMLALNRYRSDLAELKLIMKDSSQSDSQRGTAQTNIKKLRIELENRQNLIASEWNFDGDSDRYLAEKEKLMEDLFQSSQQGEPQVQGEAGKAVNLNRAFILGNNLSLQNSNQLNSDRASSDKKSNAEKEFSYSLSGNSERLFERMGDETQQRRSRLKSELKEQARDQSNFGSISQMPPAGLKSQGMGGFGGGMGGGIGGGMGGGIGGGMGGGIGGGIGIGQDGNGMMGFGGRFGQGGGSGGGVLLGDGLNAPRQQGSFDLASPNFTDAVPSIIANQVVQQRVHPNAASRRDAEKWTAAGGLSIPVSLPVSGRELAFSRIGGNPELALQIRGTEWKSWVRGLVWTVTVLLATAALIWLERRTRGSLSAFQCGVAWLLVVGILGFLLIPSADRWVFFGVFCAGLCCFIYQSRKSSVMSA